MNFLQSFFNELLANNWRLIEAFLSLGLIALVLVTGYYLVLSRKHSVSVNGEVAGELIWVDEGRNTKPFFNQAFKVFGKPDAMYNHSGHVTAVEFKSRRGRIHESDITQAKAAALAARGAGYKVESVVVKTRTTHQQIPLPRTDRALYDEIAGHIEAARSIKQGGKARSANPEPKKCASCAHNTSCAHSAAY